MEFTWIPFYKEFSQKLLQFRKDRKPLVDWIYGNLQGYITHLKDAPDGKRVPDLDPFTVLAIINRQITYDKKIEICAKFKRFLEIVSDTPKDFHGVPEMNNLMSNFIGFEKDREDGDIEKLWRVFEDAVLDKDIRNDYDELNGQYLIKYNITFGLFWIRPDKYLALDGHNREKLSSLGIASLKGKFVPYNEYEGIMQSLNEKIQKGTIPGCSNFAEFSYDAYIEDDGASKRDDPMGNTSITSVSEIAYWTFSPGEKASKWHLCVDKGIMCLGWDALGDLSQYASREDMRAEIKKQYPTDGNAKNDSLAVWQFCHEMKIGDVVFAKNGRDKIIGRGIVESDYYFDDSFTDFKHVRKIYWENVGEWKSDDMHAMKTLTNITRYKDDVQKLNRLFEAPDNVEEPLEPPTSDNYWWLVASPRIWSISGMNIGEEQYYTFYNEDGNKRRIFQHFLNAKEGDIVIGYESSPKKQVTGLLKISRIIKDEALYFIKTNNLPVIDLSVLRAEPQLANMEYMKNQQGSFFKLTPEEYKIIMRLACGEKPIEKEKYSKEDFLKDVYVSKDDYERLESLLLRKKNLILQGAPGVGKTYAAKRLPYAIMGKKDEDRIMQVQFHQNYSYEDFVMGYKPNDEGGFDLKPGKFYKFCKDAEKDREHEYFFIIDEINRGNLSKIFGELLMLIESDYRDKEIELSYKDEKFSVPTNVYIIGMMNTADRSLAMIDYALRRRFSFFEMKPGFETPQFKAYIAEKKDPKLDKLVNAIVDLNKLIESDDSLGSGFCIGHSYLCELGTEYNLESIVDYDIIPMLREYWFDNNERFNQEAQKLRSAIE